MTFRNRMIIAGAAGPLLLTIPIRQGRNQKCLMRDVEIDNRTRWQDNHWKTIVSCYSRSPWFEFYSDELRGLFYQDFERLMDFNLACFRWICEKLARSVTVSLTERWERSIHRNGLTDLRNRFSSSQKLRAEDCPVYRQVFEERTGFLPNLSIIDLLFCEGKNASRILADR